MFILLVILCFLLLSLLNQETNENFELIADPSQSQGHVPQCFMLSAVNYLIIYQRVCNSSCYMHVLCVNTILI